MPRPSKKCAECEGQFIPKNNRQILCGDECYRKRQQKQKKAKCMATITLRTKPWSCTSFIHSKVTSFFGHDYRSSVFYCSVYFAV